MILLGFILAASPAVNVFTVSVTLFPDSSVALSIVASAFLIMQSIFSTFIFALKFLPLIFGWLYAILYIFAPILYVCSFPDIFVFFIVHSYNFILLVFTVIWLKSFSANTSFTS